MLWTTKRAWIALVATLLVASPVLPAAAAPRAAAPDPVTGSPVPATSMLPGLGPLGPGPYMPTLPPSTATTTASIQALLNNPVDGVVNLPAGRFTIDPSLELKQGEQIIGYNTTLQVVPGYGDYYAMVTGVGNLSGLSITGVTFDQNAPANPITSAASLTSGQPRFVLELSQGSGITIAGDDFTNTDNANTIATGAGTSDVTISQNLFTTLNTPWHDHSSVYTDGTGAVITGNVFAGHTVVGAAIEIHGDGASVTGNQISGYYRGVNVVSSGTVVSGNDIASAANPVDLWSTVAPGLSDVTVTKNILGLDLPYWAGVMTSLGAALPAADQLEQVITDPASTFPRTNIIIDSNQS